ncbi:matrixin family metalloprotease [Synechocystis sp. LKSZ1]|uniref:matrixin family metalloprotease n=1 Tax=Synechocystis sp. LKSZ1 TaxID=3144951 RepID=UPI00336BCBB8
MLVVLIVFFSLASSPVRLLAQNSQPNPRPSHPLPASLRPYQASSPEGDYFEQIRPSPYGYLIWSRFPVTVYIEKSQEPSDGRASQQRFQQWTQAVQQALGDWKAYLSLQEVNDPAQADIQIYRREPPLGVHRDPSTGQVQIPRARNAQTRYEIYQSFTQPALLLHRMVIEIKPGMGPQSILATARHEIGHALGLWGHSPVAKDVLYFSQTAQSPPISQRDIATLIKVYQQPTQLGWPLVSGRETAP